MIRLQVAILALMLAACGTTEPTPPAADATPPERPAVPDGWVTIASDNGEAEMTVPPDLGRFELDTPVGVFLQAVLGDRGTPLQISASGPSDLPDQPTGGETRVTAYAIETAAGFAVSRSLASQTTSRPAPTRSA